ncbi:MAG TPA: hypothetical protein VND64_16635 [Pirellulales bacterium]|nr:hypothetical protein [Pirellulales bacterium]
MARSRARANEAVSAESQDDRYYRLIVDALRVCWDYRPCFGKGRKGGMTLDQFQRIYREDLFYNWMGMDSQLMYAAHKAAGGMTSIYRQIGIGCQRVFYTMLQDCLGLSEAQAAWTYRVPLPNGKSRPLSLDGRIEFADVSDSRNLERLRAWTVDAGRTLLLAGNVRKQIKGVVFEVRQGYKSKDSKRQNADLANASSAYANLYVPVLLLFSTQIDEALAERYTQARWLLLTGTMSGKPTDSTYVFCRDVLGYDLASFFERNSARCKLELETVLAQLLKA